MIVTVARRAMYVVHVFSPILGRFMDGSNVIHQAVALTFSCFTDEEESIQRQDGDQGIGVRVRPTFLCLKTLSDLFFRTLERLTSGADRGTRLLNAVPEDLVFLFVRS